MGGSTRAFTTDSPWCHRTPTCQSHTYAEMSEHGINTEMSEHGINNDGRLLVTAATFQSCEM